MSTPFIGQVSMFSFAFAPKGWAFCNGQTLPINQNQALFSLLGTTYGGNGIQTFQLPNLQGSVPIHTGTDPFGRSYVLGSIGGEANHTLQINEIPQHVHTLQAADVPATAVSPRVNSLAVPSATVGDVYGPSTGPTTLAPEAISNTGSSQPHSNLQPYIVISFCIALQGIFPSRN